MIKRIYKQICARLEKRRLDEINRKAEVLYKIGDYTDSNGILHVAIFAGGVIASYVSEETLQIAQTKVKQLRREFVYKEMKEGAV
ncbi:hypothetical protein [Alloprevotella tannerae]|uniref:hypothetical protein n=1 Tax=Alloprevotella tannerae TaxID=76122 RepID=UPI0028ECF1A5|nr:hypothetical protein [Alloprevotella tannerae]